jgi:hypothetical protein
MWVTSDVHLRLLQAQVADALEQPLAGAEHQRRDVHAQLVEVPGREVQAACPAHRC